MTATKLRIILIVIMILIAVAATAGFTMLQQYLASYASSISKLNADAQSGDDNLKTLEELKIRLAEEADLITQTRSIVADSATYTDTFLNDIGVIAARSGVDLNGVEFSDSIAASQGTATTSPTQPTSTTSTPQVGGGVTKKIVTVSVKSPVDYTRFMTFLQGIETNPLKMQVASLSLTKDKGNDIATPSLSIEVYVR